LALSIGIAKIIGGFEDTLRQNIVLAAFIPLVVYMSDAVRTQMESMIIRELQNKKRFYILKSLAKQFFVVLPIAFILSAGTWLALLLIYGDAVLAWVVALSLMVGISTSLVTGVVLPYWFWREHEDPAEASGPISTVLQDFVSVLVFLVIARAFY
jgi:magnesium transporter